VVVGVNGSAESDRAVNWAAKHASKRGLRFVAVFGTGFVGGQRTVRELVKAAPPSRCAEGPFRAHDEVALHQHVLVPGELHDQPNEAAS
jgi:hypothetical protein